MSHQTPQVHYLSDYQSPEFHLESVYLTFELEPTRTRVTNRMEVHSKGQAESLRLAGEHLTLISVAIEGQRLVAEQDYRLSATELEISVVKGQFVLEIVTEVSPQENTRLEGLYRTSGNYCTQCEAEGFRTITYFLDRPDVLSYYTTKIIADQADNAVLLSNGNLLEAGELEGGRHYAIWEDPFKKPCYLFALVAGNLAVQEDHFITADGRRVDLRIYVEPKNIAKCDHAMMSLKRSMKWDEERFGLIYDLDNYMIVAVDDFNMGAMENKGLNVFNSKFVLANPETATDVDYEGIEAVIGHEYFHNWTGNRVTCRDWFQLTLKEGLTVFRDQEFTADMLSPAVKRIEDVKRLRSNQFPEDKGPMSHPIQPQSYIEMNNFYTMTVYEKGAEVVRLYHTLLGEEGFQKGMKLYFERHDGQAVTVQDFRHAMADANQRDLSQMHHWYVQPGTPELKVEAVFDAQQETLVLTMSQWLKGAQTHDPLLIPVRFGLVSELGEALMPQPDQETAPYLHQTDQGALLTLTEHQQSFTFTGLVERPYLSLLRGFSAPVILSYEASFDEKAILAQHDSDSFVRWESMQSLMLDELKALVTEFQAQTQPKVSEDFLVVFRSVLEQTYSDLALKAHSITLPDFAFVAEQFSPMDVESTHLAYNLIKQTIAERFAETFSLMYQSLQSQGSYQYDKDAIAKRMLKNACLKYLVFVQTDKALEQYEQQQNMTDVWAALVALNEVVEPFKVDLIEDFYQRWSQDALVLDKWFALQASAQTEQAIETVQSLLTHPDFSYTNPNRVRSVLGVFGRTNLLGFHRADGAGYRLLADAVLTLDGINPQVAARIVAPFTQWQSQDSARQALMKSELQRILDKADLSKDVFEIVSKTLAV